MKHGDFTGLAGQYSRHRAGYSESVRDAILSLTGRPASEIDFVDVGAGTGIWTRMVASRKPRSAVAVEPNDDMRAHGEEDSRSYPIRWMVGSGESIPVPSASCDLATMASSFHWVDFEKGAREFHRVLRAGGRFTALWNPRMIEANPLFVEIEERLRSIIPGRKRVSSGNSEFTATLTERLYTCGLFTDVIYIEGRHVEQMSPDRYIGLWKSVNDVRVQAGEKTFAEFITWVQQRISGLTKIDATYTTRAWSARKV